MSRRSNTIMHAVQNTPDRLVLDGASPLFRPFFFGGLGILVLGVSLLIGGPLLHQSSDGSEPVGDATVPLAGLGVFLATFGFFVAMVPLAGKIPYHKQIVIDRTAGQFVRRDRTLLRLRQDIYPLDEVRTVDVEESRHVDGDPYFTLLLRLESGESVNLDRFTDQKAAGDTAGLIRDHLGFSHAAEAGHFRSTES
jgi:hypothetical protein